MKPASHALLAFALAALLPAPQAQGAIPGFRIESAQQVDADASTAEVDLVISNDGSLGDLYLIAYAKSRDGLVRGGPAPMAGPVPVPRGRGVHVSVFVARPPGSGAQHTDVLLASVQNGAWAVVATPRIDWAHDWPALEPAASSAQPASAVAAAGGAADMLPRMNWDNTIIADLNDQDFAALDLLFQEWNTPEARDESGDWKLAAFNTAFGSTALPAREARMDLIRRWRAFNPRSPGAAVAEARMWMEYAREVPGQCACGAAAEPGPLARRLFDQRLQRAEQALRASRAYASGNPLWYQASLEIAVLARRDPRYTQRLFEEASTRYPLYQPLYLIMAHYWLARGGPGAVDAVAALADRAVERTRASDGLDNYAWLFSRLGEGSAERAPDWHSVASWPRMRESFRELVRRHPSVDNYNRFAAMACRAGDKDTYLALGQQVTGHVAPDLWPGNFSMDMCDHAAREPKPERAPKAATSI